MRTPWLLIWEGDKGVGKNFSRGGLRLVQWRAPTQFSNSRVGRGGGCTPIFGRFNGQNEWMFGPGGMALASLPMAVYAYGGAANHHWCCAYECAKITDTGRAFSISAPYVMTSESRRRMRRVNQSVWREKLPTISHLIAHQSAYLCENTTGSTIKMPRINSGSYHCLWIS